MSEPAAARDELRERLVALNRSLMAGVARPLQLDGLLEGADIVRSLTLSLARDTERWAGIQRHYYEKQLELLGRYVVPAGASAPPAAAAPADRRFAAPNGAASPISSTSLNPTCSPRSG